jgi:hypothetical protein
MASSRRSGQPANTGDAIMSKTSKTSDGKTLFWCKGCESFHWVDDRWQITGDSNNPTFSPSVLVQGSGANKHCHSFVRNGKIEYLSDCNHSLAGQTIDLPDLELINGNFYSIKERP